MELPPFKRTDLKLLSSALTPQDILRWWPLMKSQVKAKANSLATYLGLADECFESLAKDWQRACAAQTESGLQRRQLNTWLAGGLLGCMEANSEHVQWIRYLVAEQGEEAMLDGRCI